MRLLSGGSGSEDLGFFTLSRCLVVALLLSVVAGAGAQEARGQTGSVPTFGTPEPIDHTFTLENINQPLSLPIATGGNGRLVYEVSFLPFGLRYDARQHAIVRCCTGFPAILTNGQYTLTATDEDGIQTTWAFRITVEDISVTYGADPFDLVLILGERFDDDDTEPGLVPLAVGNGRLVYTLQPSLPSGLRLNFYFRRGTDTDLLGTPSTAQGRTTYTVTATDEDGDTDTYNFHITVEEDTIPDFDSASEIDMTFTSGTEVTLQLPESTGGNTPLRYSLISGGLPTGLNFDTFTRRISGTPRGGQEKTQFTMRATDIHHETGDFTFHITVEGPSFGLKPSIEKTLVANTEITPFQLPEVDAGLSVGVVNPVTYSISPDTPLPPTLTFSQSNRMISGTPTAAQPRTKYTLTATDGNGAKSFYDFYITVESIDFLTRPEIDKTFVINTDIAPFQLPEAASSIGAVTYSISHRTPLPGGLRFDSGTRIISGRPTVAQPRTLHTFEVTDGTNTVTYDFHITIDSLIFDSPPVIDRTLVANIEIDPVLQLPPVTGGAGIVTYEISPSTPLPPGLRFDENTLRISGTPTTIQARTPYILTAEDSSRNRATYTFHIAVEGIIFESPPEIDVRYTEDSEIDSVLQLPSATGGGTLTYTATLPDGLSFDENSRMVSGTPTTAQGRTAYTLTATDGGNIATYTFHITVEADEQPAFVPWPEIDETFLVGIEITPFELPSASGGNGGVIYSITLPDGLSFNTGTRMVSGIPVTAQGETEYTLTATDGDRDMATFSFHITVDPNTPPDFGSASAISKTYSQSDTADLQLPEAQNGNGRPLTYELIPPLSRGLIFDSDRRVVAIDYSFANFPEAQAETTYTLIARDGDEDTSAGDTGALPFTITVEDIAPDFGSQTVDEELILGRYDEVDLPEATGNGRMTYTVTPTLSGGLRFNRFRHRVEGTPDTVRERTTYTLTARDRDGDTATLTFALTVVDIVEPSPQPTLTISPGTPSATEGGTLTFSLVLSETTTETVTVYYILTDDTATHGTDYTVSVPSTATSGTLTFEPGETSQTVVLSLIDDNENEPDETVMLTLSNLSPTASFPGGAASITSPGTIIDNDEGTPLVFAPSSPIDKTFPTNREITPFELPEATGGDGALTYSITGDLPTGLSFDPATRTISGTPTTEQLRTEYILAVTDGTNMATYTFHIEVDAYTTPDFGSSTTIDWTFTPENIGAGLTLPQAEGGNGNLTYVLNPPLPYGLGFDTERHALYRQHVSFPVAQQRTPYTLSATDEDGNQATLAFHLTVVDIEPIFDMLTYELVLRRGRFHFFPRWPATATDGNGNLIYTDSNSLPLGMSLYSGGYIRYRHILGTPINMQPRTEYAMTVTDRDGDQATLAYYITIEDDAVPYFGAESEIDMIFASGAEILSLQLPKATNGNKYPYIRRPDWQTSSQLGEGFDERYSITSGALPSGLSFNTLTRRISGTPSHGQTRTQYILTASDIDGDTATYTFHLTISGPNFGSPPEIEKTLVANRPITPFQLPEVDMSLGVNVVEPVTYSTDLPPTFTLDQSTRMISGTPDTVKERTRYTLTATDGNGAKSFYDFYITVEALAFGSPPEIDKTFIARTPIEPFELPAAEGGEGEVTYAINPALPPTLTFNPSNRMVSGTPDTAQPKRRYTLTASDGTNTDTYDFHITVRGLFFDSPPVIDRTLIANIGIDPVLQLPSATGGAGILTYAISPSTPLPSGLSFDENTLRISGTPTATQARTPYIMTVEDSSGNRATYTFHIGVEGLSFLSPPEIDVRYVEGSEIDPVLQLPAATGGGTLTYTATLPDGLSFDENSRMVSGTPTTAQPRTEYTLTATDGGNVATYTFHITVEADEQPAFVPWPEIDETFLVGIEITPFELPSASGGNGGVIYSITLPDGLSFNTGTRMVSGIPTTAQGRTEHTLTATDGDRDMATFSFHITVDPNTPPDFDSASAISKTYSQSDTADLQLPEAEDGNGALTYELIPPLSPGLSFDSDRRIVAIDYSFANFPEAQGETTYTLIARDGDEDTSDGDTGALPLTITVEDIAPDFGSQTVDEELILGRHGRVNLPFATGGNGEITYTISPALPTGLRFIPRAHVIDGTPATEQERTTYTLTAMDRDLDTATMTFALTVVDTVVDPPPVRPHLLTVSPATPSATEGGDLTFSLVLSDTTTGTVTVDYTLTDDTATHGTDYTVSVPSVATSGRLTFEPGETLQTVVLSLIDDNENETDETVMLRLSNLSSAAGFPGGAASVTSVGTIRDNDGNTQPVFASSLPIDNTFSAHKEITPFQLPKADGGDGALTYSITGSLPAGLIFDPDTRTISGTPTAEQGRTEYTLTVGDGDSDTSAGDEDTFNFHITVEPNAVPDFGSPSAIIHTFTPSNIGAGLDLPTVPVETGGDGDLTYGITPPLPSGLFLHGGLHRIVRNPGYGAFPLAQTEATHTLTATDEDGDAATFTFIIAVENTEPDFGSRTADLTFVRGGYLSAALPAATGGNGRIHYSITPSLPDGLRFGESHTIEGIPTATQVRTVYTLTATEEDRDADMATTTFHITVVDPQLTVSPPSPVVIAENAGTLTVSLALSPPIPQTVTVDYALTGGTATHGADYAFIEPTPLTSGTLVFAPDTASQTIVLSITDDFEDEGEDNETIRIEFNNLSSAAVFPGEVSGIISAVQIVDNDTNTAPVFVSQQAIEEILVVNTESPFPLHEARGGNGKVTYSITPDLPTGLAFDSDTLAITGVPTVLQGPTEYILTVGDSDGDTSAEDTDTFTFTITVEEDRQPVFAEETLEVTFVRGNYKLIPLPTVEGNGDIGYAIDPSLPSGLRLTRLNTNTLHGTPDAAQSRSEYTITARDKDGDTDTMTLYITIEETPQLTVSASSSTIAEHGGTLTFSIALDSAAPETVTVDYALTGTAQPGPDYTIDAPLTSAAGVLVFSPGSALQQTIELSIVDDKTHEKDETVILTLGSLIVAEFPGGAGSITSVVTITDNDEDPNAFIQEVNAQVLPKIAMTIASETAGAIRDRIKEAFSGVSSGLYVRGGGWRQFLAAEASRENEHAEMPDIKLSDLAFALAADDWGDSDYDYGGGSMGFRAWGRGYYHDVDFGGDIIFDGGITGGMVGVDTMIMSNLLTGVSANLFNADINFSRSGSDAARA